MLREFPIYVMCFLSSTVTELIFCLILRLVYFSPLFPAIFVHPVFFSCYSSVPLQFLYALFSFFSFYSFPRFSFPTCHILPPILLFFISSLLLALYILCGFSTLFLRVFIFFFSQLSLTPSHHRSSSCNLWYKIRDDGGSQAYQFFRHSSHMNFTD